MCVGSFGQLVIHQHPGHPKCCTHICWYIAYKMHPLEHLLCADFIFDFFWFLLWNLSSSMILGCWYLSPVANLLYSSFHV